MKETEGRRRRKRRSPKEGRKPGNKRRRSMSWIGFREGWNLSRGTGKEQERQEEGKILRNKGVKTVRKLGLVRLKTSLKYL